MLLQFYWKQIKRSNFQKKKKVTSIVGIVAETFALLRIRTKLAVVNSYLQSLEIESDTQDLKILFPFQGGYGFLAQWRMFWKFDCYKRKNSNILTYKTTTYLPITQ